MVIDFVGKRFFYIILSAIVVIPGLISLVIPPSLRLGIEFTSGTLMGVQFEQQVEQSDLRDELGRIGVSDAIIQHAGVGEYLIRMRILKAEGSGNVTDPLVRKNIEDSLRTRFGNLTVTSFDAISALVAQEIVQKAGLAVVVASMFILLYITYAFRQMPNPFRYGVCAILALIHDVFVVIGVFSIMGKVLNTEIDSMFITAVLTVIGFSVHDTIVVFDRIRENLRRMPGRDLAAVMNESLTQTLARSLMTSLTLVFTLVALLLFGGVTIQNFVLAMLIGTISGTYSSIFVASQLLIMWENGELSPSRWFNRQAQRQEAPVR